VQHGTAQNVETNVRSNIKREGKRTNGVQFSRLLDGENLFGRSHVTSIEAAE
jgi:hypothetical protein